MKVDEQTRSIQVVENQEQKKDTTIETMKIKAVNYIELIPIMVKALQEQQKQIEDLKELITKLSQGQTINSSGIILFQNTPNPVKGSTKIQYTLPQDKNRAELVITDNLGRIIKTMPLNASGIVNFNASTLSSGIYNYSLVIDNKTMETKKMTVVK
jgi:flagellar hook assembly protein FlgD